MAEEPEKKQEEEDQEETPRWLHVLLRTKFWSKCEAHNSDEDRYRAEESIFCMECFRTICPHCTHDQPGHQLLKIRRYIFRSVVRVKDMQKLGIDVSQIQTFKCNGNKVVHLRPMKRSQLHRPQAGTPRCLACNCWLHSVPHLLCSITCKRREDVSPDDFSGPEASLRIGHSTAQADVQEVTSSNASLVENQNQTFECDGDKVVHLVENENRLANGGMLRRRPRKQAKPQRAPFF